MPSILTIEDDTATEAGVVPALASAGFTVDVARSGREGIAMVMAGDYDVVALERRLPDIDGLTVVTAMRGVGIETPVLVVSSTTSVEERIEGLRAGCDDYLARPFSIDEMSARLEVLVRRRMRPATTETSLRVGPPELDLVKRKLIRGDKDLRLSPTELRLLEFMMRHAGQVLTRTMIFEGVWGGNYDPATNLVDVHIGRLRNRVDIPGEPSFIRTIRGSGYLLPEEGMPNDRE
ncbi:DNA-binding response OmpR family regulator [Paraburkholderia silvatlantica]|uniref:DNA-binding response OmpR family regulator n=1 Tax=Paraburkholderia silvatlantica TaxID=321895 RepID=A0A2V4T0P0_9BURK|nr:response regulator transcription factor [Paraburkholderia silvatlantica]PYE15757.1 DNA-binding response OmpR family regulator [Paraburkholderia silvatlantica]